MHFILTIGGFQDALDLVAGHYAVGSGFSFREDRIGRKFFTVSYIVTVMEKM